MVKTVLGVNHSGLRDWFIQRIAAVVMVIYFVGLMAWLLFNPINFFSWHWLFSHLWMKVATILFVMALLFHAWVGVWTIFTDYIKIAWLCLLLNVVVFFSLVACFWWALLILWGI